MQRPPREPHIGNGLEEDLHLINASELIRASQTVNGFQRVASFLLLLHGSMRTSLTRVADPRVDLKL